MDAATAALVKRLRIRARKRVNTFFLGGYHSAFRGAGLSFNSVREYSPGDDVRRIDWKVSARMNHLYVKEYIEERELSIVLAIDLSASTLFGTARVRQNLMMELTALFLYLARENNDRVHVVLFTDRIEGYIRPAKGRGLLSRVINEIVHFKPQGKGTDIAQACEFIHRVIKKRSTLFVISDFFDDPARYQKGLRSLAGKHDIICLRINDPAEQKLSHKGLVEFEDMETGKRHLLEVSPGPLSVPEIKDIDLIEFPTDRPIDAPLREFFEKRTRLRGINPCSGGNY